MNKASEQEKIFISYRRADSNARAGRLYDALSHYLSEELVFLDHDDLPPGACFGNYIKKRLYSAQYGLVVIGPDWLTIKDEETQKPRLDNPKDWVRQEVEILLEREIPVVPVLVGGASMPRADKLPDPLKDLTKHNAVRLDDDEWQEDVDRLVRKLRLKKETGTSGRNVAKKLAGMPEVWKYGVLSLGVMGALAVMRGAHITVTVQ